LGVIVRRARVKVQKVEGWHRTSNGDEIPDDAFAYRRFRHRCGLIKAINVFSGSSSDCMLYLDGFGNAKISMGATGFLFDSDLEDGPVVDVFFEGECTRGGPVKSRYKVDTVSMIFKDRDQMKKYLMAIITTPDPEQRTSRRSIRRSRVSSGDDDSLWPLAAGVAIGVLIS